MYKLLFQKSSVRKVGFQAAATNNPNASVKKLDQSLLGYDWIAGMLDNDSYISQKDDSFFNELKEFRRVNRSECIGSSILQ